MWRGGGGLQLLDLGQNLLFGKILAENCMKMKEIGSRGGCASLAPPGSANVIDQFN